LFWERKKGSEHLHPEGLRFGKLFEVIRDAVIAADAKAQRIVLWNSAAIGIFGFSPSEALNGTCVERLAPERFKAQHRAGMACYHETGRGPYIDANRLLDLRTRASREGNLSGTVSLSPVASDERGPYVLAIVRDVTERNRAEKFATQLLSHLSGKLISEPDISPLPDVVSLPPVPLQEAYEVKLTARELEALHMLALDKLIHRCVNTGGKR
jgi:PAS domain S-box-containing protein